MSVTGKLNGAACMSDQECKQPDLMCLEGECQCPSTMYLNAQEQCVESKANFPLHNLHLLYFWLSFESAFQKYSLFGENFNYRIIYITIKAVVTQICWCCETVWLTGIIHSILHQKKIHSKTVTMWGLILYNYSSFQGPIAVLQLIYMDFQRLIILTPCTFIFCSVFLKNVRHVFSFCTKMKI